MQIKLKEYYGGSKQPRKRIAVTAKLGILVPLFCLVIILFYIPKVADHNSEKFLIEKYLKLDSNEQSRLIYLYERPASAEYYSRGKAEVINSTKEMFSIVKQEQSVFVAISVNSVNSIPENIKNCLHKIDQFGRFVLYQKNQQYCKNCIEYSIL